MQKGACELWCPLMMMVAWLSKHVGLILIQVYTHKQCVHLLVCRNSIEICTVYNMQNLCTDRVFQQQKLIGRQSKLKATTNSSVCFRYWWSPFNVTLSWDQLNVRCCNKTSPWYIHKIPCVAGNWLIGCIAISVVCWQEVVLVRGVTVCCGRWWQV
jgi:hypothetical protein